MTAADPPGPVGSAEHAGPAAREYRMTRFEIACGSVFGRDVSVPPLPRVADSVTVRGALESVVLAALQKPPCGVSFSGGRDSSAVLAVAAHVARREGLPPPLPISLRFPAADDTVEDDYQELVVRRLGLTEWSRLTFADELDIVGPVATGVLGRFGPLFPFNAFFHDPISREVAGGTLLTGAGGDELFSSGLWHRQNLVLSGRRRPGPLDPARIALSVAPRPLRRAYLDRRLGGPPPPRPWLRPEVNALAYAEGLLSATDDSISHRRSVLRNVWQRRSRLHAAEALALVAGTHRVQVVSPFWDPHVLAAVCARQGWRDFDSRSAAMAELVGDLLPDELTSRRTKAGFDEVFWSDHARRFAAQWDGGGIDSDLVDADALRSEWSRTDDTPDARSFNLLQYVWLQQQL